MSSLINDIEVASTFQKFFDNAVTSLNLKCDEALISSTSNICDSTDIASGKFKNHPSVIFLLNNVLELTEFNFDLIESDLIIREVNFGFKEKWYFNNIPAKTLKLISQDCVPFLTRIWNDEVVANNKFPNELKLADNLIVVIEKVLVHKKHSYL